MIYYGRSILVYFIHRCSCTLANTTTHSFPPDALGCPPHGAFLFLLRGPLLKWFQDALVDLMSLLVPDSQVFLFVSLQPNSSALESISYAPFTTRSLLGGPHCLRFFPPLLKPRELDSHCGGLRGHSSLAVFTCKTAFSYCYLHFAYRLLSLQDGTIHVSCEVRLPSRASYTALCKPSGSCGLQSTYVVALLYSNTSFSRLLESS